MTNEPQDIRGSKWVSGRNVRDIAKDVRADISAAIKSGALPKGLKTSVRIERYSMGQSIEIATLALPFNPFIPKRVWQEKNVPCPSDWMRECRTPEYIAVYSVLTGILAAYNRDRSDMMTDYSNVEFHAHVELFLDNYDQLRAEALAAYQGDK